MSSSSVEDNMAAGAMGSSTRSSSRRSINSDDQDSPPVQVRSRDQWSNRWVFLLAAIGSAVGLGNLWRFPYLAYKYGGGAFLVPYVLSLLLIGAPMLILELSLGQLMQAGIVGALRRISARSVSVGVLHIATCFIILVYYVVMMSGYTPIVADIFRGSCVVNACQGLLRPGNAIKPTSNKACVLFTTFSML